MTASVQHLLESFDRLSEDERREAAAEILRRTASIDLPPLDDEALAQIAEMTFLELDAREARRPMSGDRRGEVRLVDLG